MIELYSGTPGSGKSLHMAHRIYCRLHKKGVTIGNFGVNVKCVKHCKHTYIYCDNLRLSPSRLIKFSQYYSCYLGRRLKEGEILLIIDESQILFNSRDWGHHTRNMWLSFFTQHRKLGYDIILVAQFDRMLDRQIRALIEYEYVHRKVKNAGVVGQILNVLVGGGLFVSVKKWYPLREKVGSEFFKARKKYFEIYDTFTLFNTPD